MFQGQQWIVITHIILSMGFGLFILYLHGRGALPFSRPSFPPSLSDGERLTYAFRCLAFSIWPLFMAIKAVADRRFSNIDTLGAAPTAQVNPKHEDFLVCQRILQNTLEQTVLHIVAILALASSLQVEQLSILPVLVFFFIIGRAAFFVGYLYLDHPLYRAFGFALTFSPSVFGLMYAVYIIGVRDIFHSAILQHF